MVAETFNAGDIVRVKDHRDFIASVAQKVRDRDAVVELIMGKGMSARARVRFMKRNGRGKEFNLFVSPSALVKKEAP